jgi:transcriptional regulator with XRE-family HTH domain
MATVYKLRPVKLVGPKIRQLRKERNLTQTQLSTRIGIQQSDLSRMEKGEYRVSLDTLFRILSEFEMSVGEFFDDMARETMSQRDLDLVRDFQSLDEASRRQVEQLILTKAPRRTGASFLGLGEPSGPPPQTAAEGHGG